MIRVITPLKRYQNLKDLIEFWRPLNIQWHLIIDDAPFHVQFFRDSDWIHTHIFRGEAPAGCDQCLVRLNWFLESVPLHKEDLYCFFNDDDAVEPGFFDKIRHTKNHVNIVSLKRGDNIPNPAMPHGTNTLEAKAENMHPCQCSLEQLIVSGTAAKDMRFPICNAGDGKLIEQIVTEHVTAYFPEAFAWFNYFEPGRWNRP